MAKKHPQGIKTLEARAKRAERELLLASERLLARERYVVAVDDLTTAVAKWRILFKRANARKRQMRAALNSVCGTRHDHDAANAA
jgi:capsule polysaccharide export protein KpsE/RkpR